MNPFNKIREAARTAYIEFQRDFDRFEIRFRELDAENEKTKNEMKLAERFQIAFTLWQFWIDKSVSVPSETPVDGEPGFVKPAEPKQESSEGE